MKLKDRIIELRRVPASILAPDPKNWRTHPIGPQNALRGLLAEIGISAAIAVERPEGLVLPDGYLRTELVGDETIPVLIVDLDDDEAANLLTTFDSVGSLATADTEKLEELPGEISTQSEAVQAMLDGMASRHGITSSDFSPIDNGTQGLLDQKKSVICLHCGEEFALWASSSWISATRKPVRSSSISGIIPAACPRRPEFRSASRKMGYFVVQLFSLVMVRQNW